MFVPRGCRFGSPRSWAHQGHRNFQIFGRSDFLKTRIYVSSVWGAWEEGEIHLHVFEIHFLKYWFYNLSVSLYFLDSGNMSRWQYLWKNEEQRLWTRYPDLLKDEFPFHATVDRRNPAPVAMINIPFFSPQSHKCQVVSRISDPSTVSWRRSFNTLWWLTTTASYTALEEIGYLQLAKKNFNHGRPET